MRVTMLLDNLAADPSLAAEHGLSLYIETEKHRILFDAGQSYAFALNTGASASKPGSPATPKPWA